MPNLPPPDRAALAALLDSLQRRDPVALVTAVDGSGVWAEQVGRHMVVWPDAARRPVGSLAATALADAAAEGARSALAAARHRRFTVEDTRGSLTLFAEVQLPPAHLIIVGAGHIAAPLAAIARICEFEVSVLDDRPQYANRTRFPDATRVIAGPFTAELRKLRNGKPQFDRNTYLVLVTRGHQYDVECLLEVLDDPVAYVGMIGSRRRIRAVYELLERERGIPAHKFARIHAPIGIDIAAQTPAEIAICIMAEIINVQRGGPAHSLSDALRRGLQRRAPGEERGERERMNGTPVGRVLLEVIATSAEDCATAEQGGADRIELCSALELGGLTPSLGLLTEARAATHLPIMAMVRPRGGGFCYSAGEFAAMLRDAALLVEHGADGIVFGCLHANGTVDTERTRALAMVAAGAAGKQTVFHRAFDVTPDPLAAIDLLAELGVTRILTSGQAADAVAGVEAIARYVHRARGRIEILPGAGIRPENAAEVLARTGARQLHASASGAAGDSSTAARPAIRFGAAGQAESYVRVTDAALVAALRQAVDEAGTVGGATTW